jgi:hypothetical protein
VILGFFIPLPGRQFFSGRMGIQAVGSDTALKNNLQKHNPSLPSVFSGNAHPQSSPVSNIKILSSPPFPFHKSFCLFFGIKNWLQTGDGIQHFKKMREFLRPKMLWAG